MSFGNNARKVRDPSLPYRWRVGALRSCVGLYSPYGFNATLAALEELAGPVDRDEAALLRHLDLLVESRECWRVERVAYGRRRAEEKRRGRRVPHPNEPNPSNSPDHWYGPAKRAVAVPTLTFWLRSRRGLLKTSTKDEADLALRTLSTAFVESAGHLSAEELASLEAQTWELRRRVRDDRHDYPRTVELLMVTRLLSVSAISG